MTTPAVSPSTACDSSPVALTHASSMSPLPQMAPYSVGRLPLRTQSRGVLPTVLRTYEGLIRCVRKVALLRTGLQTSGCESRAGATIGLSSGGESRTILRETDHEECDVRALLND